MNRHLLELAEAQILGFHHRNQGYDLKSLLESMGLTDREYKELKKQGMIDYLPKDLQQEIEEFLLNNL